jgi:hypothetical protein
MLQDQISWSIFVSQTAPLASTRKLHHVYEKPLKRYMITNRIKSIEEPYKQELLQRASLSAIPESETFCGIGDIGDMQRIEALLLLPEHSGMQ